MKSLPRVLLVEDSADDTYFFKRALRNSRVECELEHVWDGAAAAQRLSAGQSDPAILPSIIFLDLKMPVMSGFELLEWLRRCTLPERPIVVVLSGSDQDGDKVRAAALDAAGYLVKPVSGDDLQRWVGSKAKTSA